GGRFKSNEHQAKVFLSDERIRNPHDYRGECLKAGELAEILRSRTAEVSDLRVVTGFDGFVDEMISVVGRRRSLTAYDRVETIDRFGDRIKAAAGQSSLQEIVVSRQDPGGCAVNMGDGLAEF